MTGRFLAAAAVAAIGSVASLAGAAPTATGDLDPAFGSGGRVVLSPANGSSISDSAFQSDGKIVMGGVLSNAPPPPPLPPRRPSIESADFLAVRLTANGALDESFGNGGFARIPIDLGFTNSDSAHAIAPAPNGALVLGGYAATESNSDSAIIRLTSAGSPDPTFDGDGIQTIHFSQAGEVYGVAVQPDGRIVAVGRGYSGFTVFRLDAGGSPDPTFGTGGVVNTPLGDPSARDEARAVAISGDGKIVVAGGSDWDYPYNGQVAIARYLPSGELDPTFGTGGIVLTPGPVGSRSVAYTVELQPDGKIVVGGDSGPWGSPVRSLLARYLVGGALDPSFGTDGTVYGTSGYPELASTLAVDADGKIVVGGYWHMGAGDMDFALIRYTAGGALDGSFGPGGMHFYDLGTGGWDYGHAVLIDSGARRAVLAGVTNDADRSRIAAIGVQLGPLDAPQPPPPPPPAPPAGPPPPPPRVRCRVPRVVHLRLARARTKIRRAHCRVGRVRRIKARRFRGIVVGQSPRAGRRLARGARVNLRVGR